MKFLKFLLVLIVVPLFAFTTLHKYYISVTQIDFIQEKQSVQITSRIFIDDFENALRTQFDGSITLATNKENNLVETYTETYLKDKLKIKINGKDVPFKYIGKEYEGDIMRCYLEIVNVKNITSFEVSNEILFDVFQEQQNIVKTKINSKQKSIIQTAENHNSLLKFN